MKKTRFSQYSYIFLCVGPIYSTFIIPNFVAKVPVTFAGPQPGTQRATMVDPEVGISPSKSKGSHFEIVSGFHYLKWGDNSTIATSLGLQESAQHFLNPLCHSEWSHSVQIAEDFVGRTPRSPAERLHAKLLHEFSSVLSKQPINIGAKRASSKLEKIRATFSRPVDDAENRIVNLKLLCADVVGIFILLWEACSTFHVRVSARHAAEVGIGSTLSTSLKPGESKTSEFPPKPRLFSRTYVFIALDSLGKYLSIYLYIYYIM